MRAGNATLAGTDRLTLGDLSPGKVLVLVDIGNILGAALDLVVKVVVQRQPVAPGADLVYQLGPAAGASETEVIGQTILGVEVHESNETARGSDDG